MRSKYATEECLISTRDCQIYTTIIPFLVWCYASHSFFLQICVRSMAKCDAVIPLMAAMKRRGDAIHVAAETIKKMYDLNIPELVAQVSDRWLLPVFPVSEIMCCCFWLTWEPMRTTMYIHTNTIAWCFQKELSYISGFHREGGPGIFPPATILPPSPETLMLSMVFVTGIKQ